VFQAWSPAQNVQDESPLHTVATGRVDEEHVLGCPDGDIFLRLK
jgi:hypothetical protein